MDFIEPRADLIYGASGTTKTSQIGRAVLYYYKKTGKPSRIVTADGGGIGPLSPLVKAGLLVPWMLTTRTNLLEAAKQMSQGGWPEDPNDPNSKMLKMEDAKWQDYAVFGIEGLTSIGDAMIRRLRETQARLSQDPSYIWTEGEAMFAGGNQTYYGFVQDELNAMVARTHLIPVAGKVIWTALEGRGEEEGTKVYTFGPAIAGKKAIGKAPQWFCNCIHMESVVIEQGTDPNTKQVRLVTTPYMYLRNHADPFSKIPFPAKLRTPFQFAHEVPEYLSPPDIAKVYEMLDVMEGKVMQMIKNDDLDGLLKIPEFAMPQVAKTAEVTIPTGVVSGGPPRPSTLSGGPPKPGSQAPAAVQSPQGLPVTAPGLLLGGSPKSNSGGQ